MQSSPIPENVNGGPKGHAMLENCEPNSLSVFQENPIAEWNLLEYFGHSQTNSPNHTVFEMRSGTGAAGHPNRAQHFDRVQFLSDCEHQALNTISCLAADIYIRNSKCRE
jgi:hypothetical protein